MAPLGLGRNHVFATLSCVFSSFPYRFGPPIPKRNISFSILQIDVYILKKIPPTAQQINSLLTAYGAAALRIPMQLSVYQVDGFDLSLVPFGSFEGAVQIDAVRQFDVDEPQEP